MLRIAVQETFTLRIAMIKMVRMRPIHYNREFAYQQLKSHAIICKWLYALMLLVPMSSVGLGSFVAKIIWRGLSLTSNTPRDQASIFGEYLQRAIVGLEILFDHIGA